MNSCSHMIGKFQLNGHVTTTDNQFFPAGRWQSYVGMNALDFSLIVGVRTGDVELVPGYIFAVARPNSPEAPTTASGTWAQSDAQYRVALTDTEYFWIQPGLFARVKSGGTETPGFFDTKLLVSAHQCGQVIGRQSIEAHPPADNTLSETIVITPWAPTVGIDKFRAIIVATGCSDLEYCYHVRTSNDPETPNTWVGIGSWAALADGNSVKNSGSAGTDVSVPAGANITTNSLIQFGLATRMKSGGTLPEGYLRVVTGLLYS